MTSTRERTVRPELSRGTPTDPVAPDGRPGNESGRAVVRAMVVLRRRRVVGTGAGLDELPIAVGFGSLHEVRPGRLRAVPTRPLELAEPSSVEPATVSDGLGLDGLGLDGLGLDGPGLDGLGLDGPGQHGLLQPAALAGPGLRRRQPAVSGLHVPPATVRRLASVPVRPTARVVDPAPVRLTARGRAVLLTIAAAIGVAVVVTAWFGAGTSPAPTPAAPPAHVVVHSGDTLWTIAGRVAPNRDPRAVVDHLLRINHLDTPALVPGQVLRTH